MKKIIGIFCIFSSAVLFPMEYKDLGFYPVKHTATKASSTLIEKGKPSGYYTPSNAFDLNVKTAWCKGKKKNGTGEYLSAVLIKPVSVLGLRILNGCGTTKNLYYNNNRVKNYRIILHLKNGKDKVYEGTLADHGCSDQHPAVMSKPGVCLDLTVSGETIKFKNAHWIIGFKIEIQSIYKGKKYNDTCISEILLVRNPSEQGSAQ